MENDYFLRSFFDFTGLYIDIKKNTLNEYKTKEDFIKVLSDFEVKKKMAEGLWYFLSDSKHQEIWLSKVEVSESNVEIDFHADNIEISFIEDTSYSNEGGTHHGGYEYVFKINLEHRIFIGFEVINHN